MQYLIQSIPNFKSTFLKFSQIPSRFITPTYPSSENSTTHKKFKELCKKEKASVMHL
jgi:hypothetical protein